MEEHTIENLMDTAMTNIKEMVDVNTIVGDAVETIDGAVIIPISRVCFGFAAGGGDTDTAKKENKQKNNNQKNNSNKFTGGSGGGIMLNPMAFLIVRDDKVRLLPVSKNGTIERLVNVAPEILEKIKEILQDQNFKRKDRDSRD